MVDGCLKFIRKTRTKEVVWYRNHGFISIGTLNSNLFVRQLRDLHQSNHWMRTYVLSSSSSSSPGYLHTVREFRRVDRSKARDLTQCRANSCAREEIYGAVENIWKSVGSYVRVLEINDEKGFSCCTNMANRSNRGIPSILRHNSRFFSWIGNRTLRNGISLPVGKVYSTWK